MANEMVDRFVKFAPHLEDDIRQEYELAQWQGLTEKETEVALNRLVGTDRKEAHATATATDTGRPTACLGMEPSRTMTAGQKRRFRRNLVIAIAHRGGVSQRLLAEVFDLPRSRIGAIVAQKRRGK